MTDPFNPRGVNNRPRVDDRIWFGVAWAVLLVCVLIALGWLLVVAV